MNTPHTTTVQPSGAHPSVTAYNHLQRRNRELEAFFRWEDDLFENPHISGNHKLAIRATRRAVQRAQTYDEQGRARINLTTIAAKIGVSPDTMSRGLKVLEACGVIASHDLKKEETEDGEIQKRHYIALNEEILTKPQEIKPPTPRNHGGVRYTCPHCRSEQVRIKRRVTLICHECGVETVIEATDRDQEPEEAAAPDGQAHEAHQVDPPCRNLPDTLKPVSPPSMEQVARGAPNSKTESQLVHEERFDLENKSQQSPTAHEQEDLHAAAALLVALAGDGKEHIEMPRSGQKKYYTVFRPFGEVEALDHLQGGKARGAWCSYAAGRTRGLGFDADEQNRWELLQQAAQHLADAGYLPLLEASPADRGGHLWVIYDGLVDANAARQHVYSIAPQLAAVAEYWPGPQEAARWNKVRLPGGKYVRPGINAWCTLVSVATRQTATDGQSAARLLLTNQTPAAIVPTMIHNQDELVDQGSEEKSKMLFGHDPRVQGPERLTYSDVKSESPSQAPQDSEEKSKMLFGGLDPRWHERYDTPEGKHLWFGWTDAYVAAWWNERHDALELLDLDRKGYGLASWRGERTASVAVDQSGQRWTDFGAGARHSNGNPDSGDVLELKQRVTGAPKAAVMRAAARELLQVARDTLESAARSGAPIPSWLEEIVRDPGREHYASLAEQAGHLVAAAQMRATISATNETKWDETKIVTRCDENEHEAAPAPDGAGSDQSAQSSTGGLTGFSLGPLDTQPGQEQPGEGAFQDSGVAVPYETWELGPQGWVCLDEPVRWVREEL